MSRDWVERKGTDMKVGNPWISQGSVLGQTSSNVLKTDFGTKKQTDFSEGLSQLWVERQVLSSAAREIEIVVSEELDDLNYLKSCNRV